MTEQNWITRALQGTPIWNIGQLDKPTVRALDRLVKKGTLVKSKEMWAGICPKTVYFLV